MLAFREQFALCILVFVAVIANALKITDSDTNTNSHHDPFGILVPGHILASKHENTVKKLFRYMSSESKQTIRPCTYVCLLLLSLSNDIELNPGPRPPKYPCGNCGKGVTYKQDGIQCDGCDTWHHRICLGMSKDVYNTHAQHDSYSWSCLQCGLPNLSSGIFDYSSSSISDSSSMENSDPVHTSTPKSTKSRTRRKNQRTKVKVLNINFRSLVNKVDEFKALVDTEKPDIMIGTETWLSPEILTSEFLPEGYTLHRQDRETTGKRSGGVFIMISNKLVCAHQPQFNTKCEITWVKLEVAGSHPLYIAAYYRPHEKDEDSLDEFRRSLEMVTQKNGNVWVAGDLNFPKMKWSDQNPHVEADCQHRLIYNKFIDILTDFNFTQMVSEPTRGENILDLFLTTNETLIDKVYNFPGISDHDGVCIEANLKPRLLRVKPRKVFIYSKADWTLLKNKMEGFKTSFLASFKNKSVHTLWNEFKSALDHHINDCIPSKIIKGKSSLPWITQDIRRTARRRNKLYRRHKRTKNQQDKDKYLKLRHACRKQIKESYDNYINGIIGEDSDSHTSNRSVNSKKLFSFLKHSRQDNQGISPLWSNGKLVSDTKEKANILNRQFQSVFTQKSPISLSKLCQMKADDLKDRHQTDDSTNVISDLTISTDGIKNLLKNLKPDKAAGPDNIKPLVLRELREQIAPILQVIYSVSLQTGQVPEDWTSANVAPLYKKGDKSNPANYRPISLTCIACKLLEHIVASNLTKFLDTNDILYGLQHGFREKRSTETQLIMLVEDLVRTASNGKQTDLVLLDFSKAFDMVSHEKLLYKLHRYGVRGPILSWIRAFLGSRTQTVVLEGESSETIPVTSGVPQGSVLGPILFLVYINDLPESINSQVRLFADDTAVYLTITDKDRDGATLQTDLDRLQEWSHRWDMSFNPSKCQVIHATRARVPIPTSYTLHGQVLETVSSARYLGVDVSGNLSWNTHVDRVASTANRTLGFLKRNVKSKSPRIRECTYKTLVRPQLEYASSVWDPHTRSNIDKIEMVQRRAARWALCDYSRHSSVTSMLEKLGWRSLEQRRADSRLCLFYKIVHDLVAVPMPNYLLRTRRTLRYGHSESYTQVHTGVDFYKYSFYPLTIVQWNALPSDVVLAGDLDQFRSAVSTILHTKP